jgi:stalled ribosome rescue protein Dom34
MKKQAGLWIDHRKALVVIMTDAGGDITEITSNIERHVRVDGETSVEVGLKEDTRDRQYDNRLNTYYDQVIALIHQSETILVFGPGEAKLELKKRLEHKGVKESSIILETTDKMTEHQIAAKVRSYFKH